MSATYETWVGREEVRTERLAAWHVQALAATLGLDTAPAAGEPLPPGWHWMFFNPVVARGGLGPDGHPQRGGFLPPIELPRRMWAGSRVQYLRAPTVDSLATRTSRIARVEHKVGRRGSLWFVTVEHTIGIDSQVCIVEEQDIVYREADPPGAAARAAAPPGPESPAEWGCDIHPDTTLLFRYSALTFNGHRIHYDADYTRQVEGYPGLVVHGPLTATWLQGLAVAHAQGRELAAFEFRGVSPLFCGHSVRLEGRQESPGTLALWACGPSGELAMTATATLR
jgi:3-methylfumaryl-CoA hydratase